MKNLPTIRLRFHFTFSSYEVAFERLHREMAEIASAFKDDPKAVTLEQRKLLLRMFLDYSNGGFTQPSPTASYRTPEQAKQIAMEPAVSTLQSAKSETLEAEPINPSTTAQVLPAPIAAQQPSPSHSVATGTQEISDVTIDTPYCGLHKPDGTVSFGKFEIKAH
jgi:hypothetical protein